MWRWKRAGNRNGGQKGVQCLTHLSLLYFFFFLLAFSFCLLLILFHLSLAVLIFLVCRFLFFRGLDECGLFLALLPLTAYRVVFDSFLVPIGMGVPSFPNRFTVK